MKDEGERTGDEAAEARTEKLLAEGDSLPSSGVDDSFHPSVFKLHPSSHLRPSLRSFILALALGAVSVLGFSPFDLFFIPFATLGVLFWLWRRAANPLAAGLIGFVFALGLFGAGVSWLYISLHDFGGMPAPVAVISVFGLCAYMALFPAFAGWLAAKSAGKSAPGFALAAAAAWTLSEWARSWLFTGFPWLTIGYSQVPWSPLAGLAPLGGVYAISFATALTAALLAVLPAWKKARPNAGFILAPVLALLLLVSLGLKRLEWTEPAGEPLTVSLLQGNIAQALKFAPGRLDQQLRTYYDLAMASPSRLIIMPETAFPILARDVPPDLLASLRAHVADIQGDVIYGVAEASASNGATDYYNSVMSVGANPAQVYRKVHLVPFGEFVPPLFGWVLKVLHIPMSDFSRGARIQEPIRAAGERLAIGICYEDVFGEEVIRQLPDATLLVNISNDAWFGERIAPWQHTQIAQTRAMETGRFMLRATNTGVTSIIDWHGKLIASLPQLTTDALHGTVRGRTGATPFVIYGNAPIVALCLALLAGLWVLRRRAGQVATPYGERA